MIGFPAATGLEKSALHQGVALASYQGIAWASRALLRFVSGHRFSDARDVQFEEPL